LTLWTGQLREKVIEFFFPSRCLGCGKTGTFLCDQCCRKLPCISVPVCAKCGKPESTGLLCPACWGWQSHIDGMRSPFRFDGVMRKSIHELKYHNLKAIAGSLARLLFNYLQSGPIPGEVLVPVPLHDRRLRQRGYNQSSLITRELGMLVRLPVSEDCLIRLKNNPPQAKTETVDERRKNVSNIFACGDHSLTGKQVLLIDDVCTSGATLESCATALKSNGALSVWGLTLAREI
jgi:competence protein ComFC